MLSCCDVGAELQVLRAVVSRVLHSHTRMTSTGAAGPRRVVCTVVVPESQALNTPTVCPLRTQVRVR